MIRRRRERRGQGSLLLAAMGLFLCTWQPLHAQEAETAGRLRFLNRQLTNQAAPAEDTERVLIERAHALHALIESDPAAALSLALPTGDIERLRSRIAGRTDLLETAGEWEGRAIAIVEDDFQRGVSRTRWQMKLAGASVDLYFAGRPPALTCESQVRVKGMRLRNRVAAASATLASPATTGGCTTTGEQKVAVLLVSFPSEPLPSIPEALTPEYAQAALTGSGYSVNSWYAENSYGQVSFNSSVFGPFMLDGDYFCDVWAIQAAAIRAADATVDFSQYTRIVILFPNTSCPYGGVGTVGCQTLNSTSRVFTASTAWKNVVYVNGSIVDNAAHEMGHNFGLLHANALDFGAEPLGASDPVSREYGDPFSMMGNSGWQGHFNAEEKSWMGWIPEPRNMLTVTSNGVFTLKPLEFATTGLQAIRVRRGQTDDKWLWLEYRQPGSAFEWFPDSPNVFTGALIHYEYPQIRDQRISGLLDFNPVAAPNDFNDAALQAGRTWDDPYSSLSLTVNSATSAGLTVTVNYRESISVTPASLRFIAKAGGVPTPPAQTLTVTSSDPGSSFTVAAASTGNWLVAGPVSGSTPGSIDIRVNSTLVLPGVYQGTVTITAPGALNSPITIPVTLTAVSAAPAGYWTFDTADISGNFVLDKSGNGVTGVMAGATSVAGKVNQALSFTGAGSYVAVPDWEGIQLNHDLTLAAWIQTQNNSQKQNFIGKYDYSGSESGYLLQALPSGVVNLHVGGNNLSGGSRDAADTTAINDGQWHHVAVTIGIGQDVKFYIDGALSSTRPLAAAASKNWAPLYLGTSPGAYNGLPFTGALDDPQIYNWRLTDADIRAVSGNAGPTIAGLSPATSPQGSAFTLTVNGSGFAPGAVVIEPDAQNPTLAALATTFVSSTQLTAVAPREFAMTPGALRFQVFNGYPGGPSSNIASYTITPLEPTISGLSPSTAAAGGPDFLLTINGADFIQPCGACVAAPEPGLTLQWNNTSFVYPNLTFVSPTRLTATIPASLIAAPGTATVTVANPGSVRSDPVTFTITGATPLSLTCAHTNWIVQIGAPYSSTCTVSGGTPPYMWDTSDLAPPGITFSGNTATINLTPGANFTSIGFNLYVSDSSPVMQRAIQGIFLTIAPAVSCTPAVGPAQAGAAYSSTCTVSYGAAPYSWTIGAGALPAGLVLTVTAADGHTANVTGTPSTAGAYSYTVKATDSMAPANSATQSFSGTISGVPPPAISAAGRWSFDAADIAGNQAIDRSPNGYNGTIVNATPTAGKVNQALSFSGAGSYVSVPEPPFTDTTFGNEPLQLWHDLTLAAWVKTSNNTQKQNFISKYDFNGSEAGYMLQTLPSGVVNLRIGGNNLASGSRDAADVKPINDGQWHHVAVVITLGQNVKFYIDGQLSSTQPQVARAIRNGAGLYFGALPGSWNGQPFTGSLDEARIYPQALSAAAVAEIASVTPAALSLTCATPDGPRYRGVAYTQTCTAAGGAPPYALSATGLPTGLTATTTATSITLSGMPPADPTIGGPYSYTVQVTDSAAPSHAASQTISGQIIATPPPVITTLTPPSWPAGTRLTLTINGTGFYPGARVAVPNWPAAYTAATVTFVSSTQLTAQFKLDFTFGAGTLRFQVFNPGDVVGSSMVLYSITEVTPTILSVSPNSAPAGSAGLTLTIRGTNFFDYCDCIEPFTLGATAYWNGARVGDQSTGYGTGFVSSTELRFAIPASLLAAAGTAVITVRGPQSSSSSNPVTFTITTATPPPSLTPAGRWTFDAADIAGNQAIDKSPNQLNGTIVNATAGGGALTFSGTGSYVSVPDHAGLELSHDLTLAAWIKTSGNGQKQNFISKYDFSGSEYGYLLQALPSGVLNLHIGGNNLQSGSRDAADTRAIGDGQWHHVAVVIALGQNVRFYIDGLPSSTQPQMAMAAGNGAPLYLGTFPGAYNGGPFTGSLDDVRIYARALTAAEVAGLPGPTQINVTVAPASVTLGAGATQQFTAAATGTANTAVTWSISPAAGSISGTGLYTAPLSILAQQTVTVTATSAADATKTGTATITLAAAPTRTPAGYWTFDTADISGNLAIDRSPNGLNGAIVNATPGAGKVNQALSFSGTGSYVSVADHVALQLNHDLTLAAWIQTRNNSQKQNFIGKYDYSGSESGYLLQALPSGVVNLHVGGNNLSGGSRDAADTTAINDGQWHHVAVVITLGQNVKFYIDGHLSSTQPQAAVATKNWAVLYLGAFPGSYNGAPFTGSLDEIRISDWALSAAEVAALAGGGT